MENNENAVNLQNGENSAQENRQPEGRGEASEIPQEMQRRAEQLTQQVELLQRVTGLDMMSRFETDPEVHEKVLSGEWDFIDVYTAMDKKTQPPAPVRSGGGGGLGGMNIAGMSQSQFARLDEMLSTGGTVRM